jgi:hypothetical protein
MSEFIFEFISKFLLCAPLVLLGLPCLVILLLLYYHFSSYSDRGMIKEGDLITEEFKFIIQGKISFEDRNSVIKEIAKATPAPVEIKNVNHFRYSQKYRKETPAQESARRLKFAEEKIQPILQKALPGKKIVFYS